MSIKKYFYPENYTRRIKRFYRTHFTNTSYLVAGLGRCGTTYLTETLINSGLYPEMHFIESLSNFDNYVPGHIYKTHDYPPDHLPDELKVIYLFRNPMNIAISAHKKINEWGAIHHKHFHSDLFRPNDDILKRDTLRLENQFDSWLKPQGFSFISIKYESLFNKDTISTLNDFLGIKLKFNDAAPSQTNYNNHPLYDAITHTYKPLEKKINSAPDCKVWLKNN